MQPTAITPELKKAAEILLAAQAYLAIVRPVVQGYQTAILADRQYHIDPKWVEKGDADMVVLDAKHVYLLTDEDSNEVFTAFDEARDAHGFPARQFGWCPLLAAESAVIQAEIALMNAAQYITITNIDIANVWDMAIRREMIELTMSFVVPAAGITTTSVLGDFR